MGNETSKPEQPSTLHDAIGRFFKEMAEKHNVKVDALNLHIEGKTLYVQEYQEGVYPEFKHLESFDLNTL